MISYIRKYVVGPTRGRKKIWQAGDVFRHWIDPDFYQDGLAAMGFRRPQTDVFLYRLEGEGTFFEVMSAFGVEMQKLVLQQDQVIELCRDHPEWFSGHYHAWFLLYAWTGKFFIAQAGAGHNQGRYIYRHLLEDDSRWEGDNHHYIVAPFRKERFPDFYK